MEQRPIIHQPPATPVSLEIEQQPRGYPWPEVPSNAPESGSAADYCSIAWRRKGFILLAMLAGAVAGLLATFAFSPVYRARISLEIEDFNQDYGRLTTTSPEAPSYAALPDMKTQAEILQSDPLIERVAAKLSAGGAAAHAAPPARWRRLLHLGSLQPPSTLSIAQEAKKNLRVEATPQSRILHIEYDSADPQKAADFLNALAREFIQVTMDARWEQQWQASLWLERKVKDIREKLQQSEAELQNYARKTGLVYAADRATAAEEKLRQLQAAVSNAQADRIEKQSRYELVRTAPAQTLPDVLNDASLREYQLRYTELQRQLAEGSTTYTDESPRQQRIQAQINTLRAAVERERAAILDKIRNEYDQAARKENLLKAEYAEQTGQVSQQAGDRVQYNMLLREVESNRQLYDAITLRVKESGISSALRPNNVRALGPAEPPRFPHSPRPVLNVALGMFAAFFCATAFVFLKEGTAQSFRRPGEARLRLNTPELGAVLSVSSEFRNPFRLFRRPLPLAISPAAASEPGSDQVALVTHQRKLSAPAASFRAVVASILFSDSRPHPQAIVFTSAGAGEGKTTVVSNIAIALAEIGHRVLVIDGDMRKPRLHKVFGLSNAVGLSTVLEQRMPLDRVIREAVQETRVAGLSVLTAGQPSTDSTPLLYSTHLSELLRVLKTQFDTIVIDSVPALSAPDARILGRAADSVVLVARAGKTLMSAAEAMRQRFADDGTQVLGFILNDWTPDWTSALAYGYGKYRS